MLKTIKLHAYIEFTWDTEAGDKIPSDEEIINMSHAYVSAMDYREIGAQMQFTGKHDIFVKGD